MEFIRVFPFYAHMAVIYVSEPPFGRVNNTIKNLKKYFRMLWRPLFLFSILFLKYSFEVRFNINTHRVPSGRR